MIHNLKPYPAYKDSGVPWMEKVPEHWDILRGKNVFLVIDIRSETGEEELLTVSSNDGVVPRSQKTVTMFKAESYIGHKLCWPGDLVINSLWAWMQGLGFSKHHGLVSSAYSVYRPRQKFNSYSYYFNYLLRSAVYKWELQTRSKGVWLSRLQLSDPAFLDMPIIIPPLPELSAIVRYLDYMDRRIRRYIHAKQKLIKRLEEQKQAIIHRAVTRGLDPNVKLKPSGVEWLGDVPEHWEIKPLKRAFISMDYGISESSTNDGTIRLLTMGHIQNGSVKVPNDGGVSTVDPSLLLKPNDLLFNRTNSADLVGKVGLFTGSDSMVTFASYLVRMRPKKENNPEFLNILLNDVSVLSVAHREAIPSLHQSNLNPTRYGRFHISLPDFSEQVSIVNFLHQTTVHLNAAITSFQREITFLREYRTRLIADVVTGKLDVREAVASLPDEIEEPEVIENELAEGEEETEDPIIGDTSEGEL